MSTPSKDRELRREIVIELSNAYFETYRYERPNDSVEQLGAFCRDLAENDVDDLLKAYRDSLKQSLVAEMPEKLNYHEAIGDIIGHDDKELESYDKGFNKARQYFLQGINKVFNGRM